MNTLLGTKIWWRTLLAPLALLALVACSDSGTTETAAPEQQAAATPTPEDGYRRINSANDADLLNAQIFELDNGLQVFLTENHEEPRFYAEIAVRAGSKHDPADATGLAHYLEHLL
ncbi:MAG: insulinase family protein, partial [Gammaproteobacteria bacterium]|nr:insulinase family protein [Gammaproteobacteria bacterium]